MQRPSSDSPSQRTRQALAAIALMLVAGLSTGHEVSAAGPVDVVIPSATPPPAVDWDGTTDFGALRDLWGHRFDYDQRCYFTDVLLASNRADSFGKPQQAYDLTRQFLERCPVSESAHFWAGLWARRLGNAHDVALHQRWFDGLLRSILASGDGQGMATAWVTVAGSEPPELIRYLGLERLRLDHVAKMPDGGFVQVVAVTPKGGGAERLVYFREHLFFVRQRAHLNAQPPEDIAPSLSPASRAADEP